MSETWPSEVSPREASPSEKTTPESPSPEATSPSDKTWPAPLVTVYRAFGYLGLVSIFGSLLIGFGYDPQASAANWLVDVVLYGLFIVPHLVMTRSWYKQRVWANPAGSPRERRVYITVSVVTWWGVWFVHRPLPGPAVVWPLAEVVSFVGVLSFLLCVVLFFQGVTFEMLDGLLGVPGAAGTHTHGAETPLLSEGPYSSVRHPMYRAALLVSLATLLVHPNAAQLFWALVIPATFIGYIPVEEAQLLAARGDEYRRYQQRTPYRVFRGIW